MLYHLLLFFKSFCSSTHLSFLLLRATVALLGSFALSLVLGKSFISKWRNVLQPGARPWTPEQHQEKNAIPSMGGLFILASIVIMMLLCLDLSSGQTWLFLLCMLLFGAIGGWDDWSKITTKRGISAAMKFNLQVVAACICMIVWIYGIQGSTLLVIPFMQGWMPNLGLFYGVWGAFILVAMSNAVNITDGLDGLATGSLIPNIVVFGVIACMLASGAASVDPALFQVHAVAELAIIAAILVGSCLGFLWYNAYPAQIFMGDVGSLSLGAGLALCAIMVKHELLLLLTAGIFILETVSDILQVASVKLRKGKRIFKMAPIHHHFELIGWKETKIVARFTIITVLLCVCAVVVFITGCIRAN